MKFIESIRIFSMNAFVIIFEYSLASSISLSQKMIQFPKRMWIYEGIYWRLHVSIIHEYNLIETLSVTYLYSSFYESRNISISIIMLCNYSCEHCCINYLTNCIIVDVLNHVLFSYYKIYIFGFKLFLEYFCQKYKFKDSIKVI